MTTMFSATALQCLGCGAPFRRAPRSRALCCSIACARARHRATRQQQQRVDTAPPLPSVPPAPIPMLLWCPECRARHVDHGDFALRSHHTHACQTCGHVWRPAIVPTVGVRFLPGFRNGGAP